VVFDHTSIRYLNQQRNEVALDIKEEMETNHWDDVEAGSQFLPQRIFRETRYQDI